MRALLSVAGVIQLGGPPTLNWCIDEQHCAIFGVPPTKPPAPGTNQTLTPGGPFSTNCTDNPNWCHANMAQISMGCTRGPELAGAVEKPHNHGRAHAEARETPKNADCITQYASRLP